MSSSETILKAALNTLKARLGEKLINVKDEINNLAQDAPEKIQKEWDIFQEDVKNEIDRLDKENSSSKQESSNRNKQSIGINNKINDMRKRVSNLNKMLETNKI